SYRPVEPMDMKFGPDGDLYVLEYGSVWFGPAPDAKLVRIEYNAGNRAPDVEISSNVTGGALPFSATLSAAGTRDPDNDRLTYEWRVVPAAGGPARSFTGETASVPFTSPGAYNVTLTARDPAGMTASETMRILAGNAPPEIAINVTGNRSFYFPGQAVPYAVQVTDREDANVPAQNVALSMEYVPENFPLTALRQGDRPVNPTTRFAVAQAIMANSTCRACHTPDGPRSVGPNFTEVAAKYQGDSAAFGRLVAKIRGGGSGVWGPVNMPAHPGLSVAEASALVRYILASNSTSINPNPLAGSYTPDVPEGDNGRGAVVLRAVYTDRGAAGVPGQTAERMLVLRSPIVAAGSADILENVTTVATNRGAGPLSVQARSNGHIGFRQIDLTGIRTINLVAAATTREAHTGGTIEIRAGSPTGQLLGQAEVRIAAPTQPGAQQLQNQGGAAAPAAGAAGAAPRPAGAAAPAAGGGGGGGGGGQGANAGLRVEITPMTGPQDLYFVFRNPNARATQTLFSLSTITFGR
ncbi:MAG: PKD domain-containing protein, partial [Gemmatimonadetes bacterium]|nr:PKD domain-containing protein [Gemmatimonadota bacterium]